MKDPAVLFYTADFLIGVSDLTDEECGKYIKLLCLQHQKGHLSEKQICLFFSLPYEEHMKNICSTYEKEVKNICSTYEKEVKNENGTKTQTKVLKNFFSAELLSKFKIDENGNLFNERFEEEARKRAKFSDSRRNNRKKKTDSEEDMKNICSTYEKDMKNICLTYVEHMENENVNENENTYSIKRIDPYFSNEKIIFENKYKEIFGQAPFLTNEDCMNFSELASTVKDFFETLEDNLKKTKKLDFKQIGYKPDAGWFLKPKNYAALRNGVYDAQIEENGKNDGFDY